MKILCFDFIHSLFLNRKFIRLGEYNTESEKDCVDIDCAYPPQDFVIASKGN